VVQQAGSNHYAMLFYRFDIVIRTKILWILDEYTGCLHLMMHPG